MAAGGVPETMPFGGGSVILWSGIYGRDRTPLVIVNTNFTARHYIDDIMCPTVLPFPQQQPYGAFISMTTPDPM